jgi:hypothetical protein
MHLYIYIGGIKMQTVKVLLKDKYIWVMIMIVVSMFIGYKVSEYNQAQQIQHQKTVEQGQKAKALTQWKLDHYGTIPAYKD